MTKYNSYTIITKSGKTFTKLYNKEYSKAQINVFVETWIANRNMFREVKTWYVENIDTGAKEWR